MFSFLTSKPLFLVIMFLLSTNLLFAYLSYTFYGDKVEAVGQVVQLKQTLSDSRESSNKADSACVISHSLVSEYQEDKRGIESVEREALEAIDKLPNEQPKVVQQEKGNVQKIVEAEPVVSLNSRLPDSLRGLLKQTYDSVQGQSTRHP